MAHIKAPAEREMIATNVSSRNDCYFSQHAHGAVAAYRLGGNEKLVNDVKLNFESAAISEKMKVLLPIAGKVQKGGKQVTPAVFLPRYSDSKATDLA